ncbi:hypothetical protein DYB30_007145 [Aphanomyces astaci]|uniref:Uncharacterized protein n=1 Tax=Aphanomyces astaci TaxID=112090 RepID=A0A397FC54_APHAT|nr:hypothetical protein DYB30_007145 [Aphanomyces astaci]RHZ19296.1 hypothetical protein DYB31_011746 [Aphanomyces astaci]
MSGRLGYALEVAEGCPTEVLRDELAVEQASLDGHDGYEESAGTRLRRRKHEMVLPVQVESQVTRPEKPAPPSVNDMSVRWVFTRHQIVRYDFPGIVERLHSDMEDRMLPLTRADVADQVRKIRDRRKSPTHRDIAEVIMQAIQIKLTDEDMRLLETPADVDDPARWLRWFASVPGDV